MQCAHTGLDLQDIWRYFRHTWSNQYTSVPGSMIGRLIHVGHRASIGAHLERSSRR